MADGSIKTLLLYSVLIHRNRRKSDPVAIRTVSNSRIRGFKTKHNKTVNYIR